MPVPSLKPTRPVSIRLVFGPDFASARAVSVETRSFLAEQGVPEKELFSYELCIAEACYNAIEYVEGPAQELEPIAEVEFTPDHIEMRVTDHTAGFDLPERVQPPSPQIDRGRGLFLIQSVMDEVRYLRGQRENILIMRKKRRYIDASQEARDRNSAYSTSLESCQQQLAESKRAIVSMSGELSIRSEALSAIFRCCAELGRTDDVATGFGERLLSELLHLTSADWYVLRMISADKRQLVVAAASDPSLVCGPIDLPASHETPRGFEATAAANQAQVRVDIGQCSDATEPLRAVGPQGVGLVCPLNFGGTLLGTITVGRRSGDFQMGRLQDELIRTFAEFLAIQTLNIRHRKEEVRNRVVARELEIAQEIQHLLLPRTLPQMPGFGLAGGWHSAREVGGDFYDALALGDQALLLMMVDVMGKGVPAALFATTMRGLLRGLAARNPDPAQLLSSLNRLLHSELSAVNMYITVQIVHVDLQTRKVTVASAGHCPLLIVHPSRRAISTLTTQAIPIGVLPDTLYQDAADTLETPSVLLLYTDGLTDTQNPQGKTFGQRRLMAWLRATAIPGRSAAELRDLLTAELNQFRGRAAMADDQAFLVLADESSNISQGHVGGMPRRIRFQPGNFLFPANA